MGLLDKLLKNRVPKEQGASHNSVQAVLVELKGDGLPQSIYDQYDLSGLEEELETALDGSDTGELDGHELPSTGVTVYLYGADAEALFKKVEPVLRNYPLCEGAFITIRQGEPGAQQRTLLL